MSLPKLIKEKENDGYYCIVDIQNQNVRINVANKEESDIKIIKDIKNWINANYETMKDYTADGLLEEKNDVWLDKVKNEKPITKKDFISRIFLKGITIENDYSFEICFDNDLFMGAYLNLYVTNKYEIDDVFIQG